MELDSVNRIGMAEIRDKRHICLNMIMNSKESIEFGGKGGQISE
jgi:hypothetical protein